MLATKKLAETKWSRIIYTDYIHAIRRHMHSLTPVILRKQNQATPPVVQSVEMVLSGSIHFKSLEEFDSSQLHSRSSHDIAFLRSSLPYRVVFHVSHIQATRPHLTMHVTKGGNQRHEYCHNNWGIQGHPLYGRENIPFHRRNFQLYCWVN
jgi:hypothetical protein